MVRTPFIRSLCAVTLGLLLIGGWVWRWQTARTRAELTWQLQERAIWGAAWRAVHQHWSPDELQRELVHLAESIDPLAASMRVSIVNLDGVVAADSAEPDAIGRNVHDQPDVLAALARGIGVTDSDSAWWVVSKVVMVDETPREIVRVKLPTTAVQELLRERRLPWMVGLFSLWSMVACVLWWILRRPANTVMESVSGDDSADVGNRSSIDSYHALIDSLADGVLVVDATDRLIVCNAAAEHVVTDGALPWRERYVWEVVRWPELRVLMAAARGARSAVEQELRVTTGRGERLLWVRAVARETAAHAWVVMTVRDVTELRRLERVRRDFVANVSHELKTPLMAAVGYLDLLQEQRTDWSPTEQGWLEKLTYSVERLQRLVQDLLLLARSESVPETPLRPCDLVPHVREVVARWQENAARKGVPLIADLPDAPLWVLAEPSGLSQILDNLLANALRFTAQGEVRIAARPDVAQIVITVQDTGIGIPPREQERVFERFYQVDGARGRERGGTGLGLAIVKHFVQGFGGSVTVQSTEGVGSRFIVRLPANVSPS